MVEERTSRGKSITILAEEGQKEKAKMLAEKLGLPVME